MTTGRAVQSAIDIGHGTIRVIIAERVEDEKIRVLGAGAVPSKGGLNRGTPLAMQPMIQSIGDAVDAAEDAASKLHGKVDVESVHLGVSGADLTCSSHKANLLVTRNPQDSRSSLIQESHVRQVQLLAESGQSVQIENQILHRLPQEYVVDLADGVRNPVGLHGTKLECTTHFLSVPVNTVESLRRCVQRSSVEVASITLTSLAASAVLSRDERELGVLLLDMGAASTDLILHVDGKVCHAASVPMGGAAITSDISRAFRTPSSEAERIKRVHGACDARQIKRDDRFEIVFAGSDSSERASRSQLCQVIQPRLEEILEKVERQLELANMRWMLGGGIVITGGGACLKGLVELMRDRYALPVRLGYPRGVLGLDLVPAALEWTPVLGLAQFALRHARPGRAQRARLPLRDIVSRLRRQVAL